jgi:hypothetical protein
VGADAGMIVAQPMQALTPDEPVVTRLLHAPEAVVLVSTSS